MIVGLIFMGVRIAVIYDHVITVAVRNFDIVIVTLRAGGSDHWAVSCRLEVERGSQSGYPL